MPQEILTMPDGRRWRLVWWQEKDGGETAMLTELDEQPNDAPRERPDGASP